jgi:hypothetical protein
MHYFWSQLIALTHLAHTTGGRLLDIGGPKSHDTTGLFPPILVRFWITVVYSK